MRWAFLLGSPRISGGSYVIFEHAVRARRRGCDVTVVTESPLEPGDLDWYPEARELTWHTYSQARDREFDAVIATWWPTSYNLPRMKARNYCYFVQSIESRFYGEADRHLRDFAERTYRLPASFITEATWIRDYLASNYGGQAALVHNGVRKDIYRLDAPAHAPRQPGKLRVLVEGSVQAPFKNVPRTVELCRQSQADEIWMLTPTPIDHYPGIDRLFSNIPIRDTVPVYRSCDVIVKLSYVEGMFGPPLEIFHCGGTAIVYDVTGHDEYIRHDHNALVCGRDDEKAVIQSINQLKNDPALLERLKRGGLETAAAWPDWEQAALAFEAAIVRSVRNGECSRERLLQSGELFAEWLFHKQREQEDTIANQDRMLKERWAVMQNMESMILARDEAIAAQARNLDARWEAMQRMERLIRERDGAIAAQNRLLAERLHLTPAGQAMRANGSDLSASSNHDRAGLLRRLVRRLGRPLRRS